MDSFPLDYCWADYHYSRTMEWHTHTSMYTAWAVVARRCMVNLPSLWKHYWGRGWQMLGGPSFINARLIPAHRRCPSRCYLIVNRGGGAACKLASGKLVSLLQISRCFVNMNRIICGWSLVPAGLGLAYILGPLWILLWSHLTFLGHVRAAEALFQSLVVNWNTEKACLCSAHNGSLLPWLEEFV